MIYHGVRSTAAGVLYRLGLALFDLERPRAPACCAARSGSSAPEAPYEYTGDVGYKSSSPAATPSAPTATTLRLYYGAADTCVALATGSIQAILEWLGRTGRPPGDAR